MQNYNRKNQEPKMVVIGLDGATFRILDPLVEKRRMPHLEKILNSGSRASLLSTLPPFTGPSWVSFMTGKRPENHGVFDFLRSTPGSYKRRFVDYSCIRGQTLWSILSNNGYRIGVINVPITYPPPKVNGYIISGMLTPNVRVNFTYPSPLKEEVIKNVGEYTIDVIRHLYDDRTIDQFLQRVISCTKQRIKTAHFLLQKNEIDFCMIVFIGLDRIQHFLWEYIEKGITENSLSPRDERIVELIFSYYHEVDHFIGHIRDHIGVEANLIILSDHGFGPLKGRFHLNDWLEQNGFLCFDPQKMNRLRRKEGFRKAFEKTIKKMDPLQLRRILLPNPSWSAGWMRNYDFLDCIDWSRTSAYSTSATDQGIHINLQGREPRGIIQPGQDYERLRDHIIRELRKVKGPHTEDPVMEDLYKREDIYEGQYTESAPDIVFVFKEGEYIPAVEPGGFLFEPANVHTGTGTHRKEGIFLALGPQINEGVKNKPIEIIDVAPTILHILGLPIPSDMDGKVARGILKDDFLLGNPIQYLQVKGQEHIENKEDHGFSLSEEETIRKLLKSLGYLG